MYRNGCSLAPLSLRTPWEGERRGEHSHLIKFDVHARLFPAKSAPTAPKGGPGVIHHALVVCDIQSQRLPTAHINPSIRLHDG